MNPDGTPTCPPLAAVAQPREAFPLADPWAPAPATREDVLHTLEVRDFVTKIDSVAGTIRVTPGGYFARPSQLECWDDTPTREPVQ